MVQMLLFWFLYGSLQLMQGRHITCCTVFVNYYATLSQQFYLMLYRNSRCCASNISVRSTFQ